MIYEYRCYQCIRAFDVVKPAAQMANEEYCPLCKAVGERQFVPSRLYLNGTAVQHAEYNPGLGCIVKDKAHRKEICKIKGVEEIGNEKPDSLHKHFDQKREDLRNERWDTADKGWVGSDG